MQKIYYKAFDSKQGKEIAVDNVIVASTKTLNIHLEDVEATQGLIVKTTTVKQETFYLDNAKAKEIAKQISIECLGNENAMFIEHILNTFKNGCIVEREKQSK